MMDKFTQKDINELAEKSIADMGEADGYMYVGWFFHNARRLVNDYFGGEYGKDYTDEDSTRHHEAIIEYMVGKYNEWIASL